MAKKPGFQLGDDDVSVTDLCRIAYTTGRDDGMWHEVEARAKAKAKGRKSRKYWRRRAKHLNKIIRILNANPLINALERCEDELRVTKEQLMEERRGRDDDKRKLDEMTYVYRKYRRSTAGRRLSDCVSGIAKILGGVASADNPFLEVYDDPALLHKELRAAKEMIAAREGDVRDCETELRKRREELRATKELLAIREEQLEAELKCMAANFEKLEDIRRIQTFWEKTHYTHLEPMARNAMREIGSILLPPTPSPKAAYINRMADDSIQKVEESE